MYRATTPTHNFMFEVNPDTTFRSILITYVQGNEIVLEKTKEDLTFSETTNCKGDVVYQASLHLSQEETNSFSAQSPVTVQIRALTYDDEAIASEKMNVAVRDVLNDEVLT